jgi:hypothetical protein
MNGGTVVVLELNLGPRSWTTAARRSRDGAAPLRQEITLDNRG